MLHNLRDIRDAANNGASPHWFSRETMDFFNAAVCAKVFPVPDGALFVSSEQFNSLIPRRYTLRHCSDNGEISTVGEFQEHGSQTAAYMAATAERDSRR